MALLLFTTFATVPKDSSYQDTILKKDTIYGISNETVFPVRKIEPKNLKEEEPTKHLFEPKPHKVEIASWQIIILLVSIVLMGFVKAFSNNRYKLGIKSLLNYTVAQEIIREEKVFFHRSNIIFTLIHLITAALFIFQLKSLIYSTGTIGNNFYDYLLILTFLAVMYLIKFLFSKLLLFVFNEKNIAPEYIFNVSLYNSLLGAALVPVLCMLYFTSLPLQIVLYFVAIPAVVIIFILRLIRLFKIGQNKEISYLYLFVYICTLEILPLLVLLKIFIFK